MASAAQSKTGESESKTFRCAIYTRKSTEEGLNQEFNSLDAQREAAEAYIRSQRQSGWTALGERYDDGGYSGANLERPALRRLLQDIQAGKIECVVVYKIDRLSRSLLDFSQLMEILERQQVSLVSVTQPLNTTTSMGRLTLNILLSFAQFERDMIADRTRDKMAAARRKGKWVGGKPMLGYDISAAGGKLVVNEQEAGQVQAIFEVYLQCRSLGATLAELEARQWQTKHWRSRDGVEHMGRRFTKTSLQRLLSNVLYVGRVSYQGQEHMGEQEAIIEQSVWQRVQRRLAEEREARRVAAQRQPEKLRNPARPASSTAQRAERVPRVARLLALALKFEELIDSGQVSNYAALAQVASISRSRVTQMINLLNLAPDIQEEILFLQPEEARRRRTCEPWLRKLTSTLHWAQQREQWRSLRQRRPES